MIRSALEQSVRRSSPSETVSGYLNASINEIRQLILDAGQFREWAIEAAFIRLKVARYGGFQLCAVNPDRQDPRLRRAFHRAQQRFKKIEDYKFVSLSMAPPHGKDCNPVLVLVRSRFQRFAAMRTVGNLASPCYFQCPEAERAAARPFVIAFRTFAENNVRAAQEFVAFSKRDEESAIPVCADQEFFQDRIPLATGRFWNSDKTIGRPGIR